MKDKAVTELRRTPIKSLRLGRLSDLLRELRHKEAFEVRECGKTFKYDKHHSVGEYEKVQRKTPHAKNPQRATCSGSQAQPKPKTRHRSQSKT